MLTTDIAPAKRLSFRLCGTNYPVFNPAVEIKKKLQIFVRMS